MNKNRAVISRDIWNLIKTLDYDNKCVILISIIEYKLENKEPDLNPTLKTIFLFIKKALDKNSKREKFNANERSMSAYRALIKDEKEREKRQRKKDKESFLPYNPSYKEKENKEKEGKEIEKKINPSHLFHKAPQRNETEFSEAKSEIEISDTPSKPSEAKKEKEKSSAKKEKEELGDLSNLLFKDEEVINSSEKTAETEENKPKIKFFTPPTVEQVREYCTKRKNNVDAEMFCAFYESKGWLIGKNKMKDWKSAVITWEKSSKRNGHTNSNGFYAGRPESDNEDSTSYISVLV